MSMRASTRLLPNLRIERVCSFCSMRDVSADPRTYRLMMHAQLASDATVTHALFCKRQSLSFSRLIGLPDTWLRGEVQLARTTAKTLTPRSIFPAFEDLRRLLTLRTHWENTAPRASHRCALLH